MSRRKDVQVELRKARSLKVAIPTALAVLLYLASRWGNAAGLSVGLLAILWGLILISAVKAISAFLQETGLGAKYSLRQLTADYTTRDIMVMAALVAVGGIAKGYWGRIRMILEPLGPFSSLIIAPGFYLWGVLGAYLIRKPLSGTISMVLGGIVEILIGNPYGLPVLLFNFWEGLGPDLGYTIRGKYTYGGAILGCLLGSAFGIFYSGFTAGFQFLDSRLLLLQRVIGFAGAALGGIVGQWIAGRLEELGVRKETQTTIEPA